MVTVTTTSADGTTSSYTYSASSLDLDTDALVNAAVNSRMQAAYTLEDKIEDNETTIESYTELQSLLTDMQDACDALRNSQAISDEDTNVFNTRTAYLTTSDSSDAGDYMDVTVDSGTETGTYDIAIEQIATAQKVSGTSVEDSSEALGYTGVFSIALGDGDSAEISVDSDMSLEDIQDAINDVSDTTSVKASIVQVDDSANTLVLTAQDTGSDMTISVVSGDDIMTDLGITDSSGGDFTNVLTESQDAIITVDGLEVTRDSNDIDDVIDGVTFHLYSATEDDATISVEVASDVSNIKDAIIDFVDAYNSYREFYAENQATGTDGTASDDAVLFGDSYLRAVNTEISSMLSEDHDGISLRDLGIELDEDNNLTYDEDTLNDMLLDDLDSVLALFGAQFDSSSSELGILYSADGLGDTDFTIDLEVDSDGELLAASVDGDSSLFTISGSRIKGAEGTIYEGLTLVYTGDTSQSIDISFSQGIADSLYYTTENYADSSDGILADLISDLDEQNSDYEDDIDDITERAETYRSTLETKYANMQTAYETASLQLQQLEAYTDDDDD